MKITPPVDRVLRRVDTQDAGKCWLWLGATGPTGYGSIRRSNRIADGMAYVHRVVYEALVGPIPTGLVIDHLCRVRNCVNPAHLEPVTCRENLIRGETIVAANVAKTECPLGHQYDAANTYYHKGARHCRACRDIHRAAHEGRTRGGGENPLLRQSDRLTIGGGRHA